MEDYKGLGFSASNYGAALAEMSKLITLGREYALALKLYIEWEEASGGKHMFADKLGELKALEAVRGVVMAAIAKEEVELLEHTSASAR